MVDIRFDLPERLVRCWACGRTEGQRPLEWNAVWFLENAHIVGGPGKGKHQDTRQAIVLLDTRCHRLAHGDAIADRGRQLPNMTRENLAWLKMMRDGPHYDRAKLHEWFGKPLKPARPDQWFIDQWNERMVPGWQQRSI